jgi:hypothetical protein
LESLKTAKKKFGGGVFASLIGKGGFSDEKFGRSAFWAQSKDFPNFCAKQRR